MRSLLYCKLQGMMQVCVCVYVCVYVCVCVCVCMYGVCIFHIGMDLKIDLKVQSIQYRPDTVSCTSNAQTWRSSADNHYH